MDYNSRIFGILNEAYERDWDTPPNIDRALGIDPEDDYGLEPYQEAVKIANEYISGGSQGDLDLSGYGIRELPMGLDYIGGSLNLSGCSVLESLPDNFEVRGDLNISKCKSLNKLPTGLIVYGDLDASGSGLSHVEGGVTIRGFSNVENTPIEDTWNKVKAKNPGIE